MEMRVLVKSELFSLLDKILADIPMVGVKEREGKYIYDYMGSGEEICLDFDVTVQSPKRFILPPQEVILQFSLGEKIQVESYLKANPQIIWGVHPYDIKAINFLDKVFQSENMDEHYLAKRRSTIIVGMDPLRASEKSFWASMEADKVDEGFDLFLTDIGEDYVITIGTERGRKILYKYGILTSATSSQVKARGSAKAKLKDLCLPGRKLNFPLKLLPYILMRGEEEEMWKEKAEKCFSCGSCNLVCPTCYCFDVQEEVSENLREGRRCRVWDGCLLEDFAKVATGENFRGERYQRFRHRFYRKGLYLKKKYGEFACVGCGRCASACLPDIADPVEIFNVLYDSLKGVLTYE